MQTNGITHRPWVLLPIKTRQSSSVSRWKTIVCRNTTSRSWTRRSSGAGLAATASRSSRCASPARPSSSRRRRSCWPSPVPPGKSRRPPPYATCRAPAILGVRMLRRAADCEFGSGLTDERVISRNRRVWSAVLFYWFTLCWEFDWIFFSREEGIDGLYRSLGMRWMWKLCLSLRNSLLYIWIC